jgi:hypothetical protein
MESLDEEEVVIVIEVRDLDIDGGRGGGRYGGRKLQDG